MKASEFKTTKKAQPSKRKANKRSKIMLGLGAGVIVIIIATFTVTKVWLGEAKVTVDTEFLCNETSCETKTIDKSEFEQLAAQKKSFLLFVDQGGCTTADTLREFIAEYAEESVIRFYRMMFSDMKETILHEQIKYDPSIAIIDKGKAKAWLKADSNEDVERYNDYEAFKNWLEKYIEQ